MPTGSRQRLDQVQRFNEACLARALPLAIRRDGEDLALLDSTRRRTIEHSRFANVIVFLGLARARRCFGVDLLPSMAAASVAHVRPD